MVFNMQRRLREIGGSYAITIPKQVCDLYNFNPGDLIEIEPINIGELRLKKDIPTPKNNEKTIDQSSPSKKTEKAVEKVISKHIK